MSEMNPIDIEILVLTYNRSAFLRTTLESLLAQKHPASRICVLDNGSTDDTQFVVQSFAPRGVELVRRAQNDPRECWPELQAMARGPWTMLFHDDDLLHPNYLSDVAAVIAVEPLTTVVVSAMNVHQNPETAAWGKVRGHRWRTRTGRQLAEDLYRGFRMPFCSAVYRTDVLQGLSPRFDVYGKIFDRPFVIDAACAGKAVVMRDAYVKYRTHAKQDSADTSSGPFLSEVLALQAYYGKILGDRLTQSAGRAFLRRNYQNLINEFARLNPNNTVSLSKGDFLRRAINVGAASSRSIRCGTIYTGLSSIPRLIERRFKQILGRSRS
jgi:glycosyltransferase involved in cell wall biosynthesis